MKRARRYRGGRDGYWLRLHLALILLWPAINQNTHGTSDATNAIWSETARWEMTCQYRNWHGRTQRSMIDKIFIAITFYMLNFLQRFGPTLFDADCSTDLASSRSFSTIFPLKDSDAYVTVSLHK